MKAADRTDWVERGGRWWPLVAAGWLALLIGARRAMEHTRPALSWQRAMATVLVYAAVGLLVFVGGMRYAERCRRIGRKTMLLYRPRRRSERP